MGDNLRIFGVEYQNATGIKAKNTSGTTLTFTSNVLQSKTISPTESQQTVSPDSGYSGLSSVTVNAVSSSYVGSGIARKSSSDLTVSGATVTAPIGYYSSAASKSVASGTAGTPTATKGSVSNHSVSITPSVTNTTGYITGSTKTGTAVTVTASELASGNKAITENGTGISVVGYSTVSVDVPTGGSTSEVTVSTSGAVTQALQPNTVYHFTSTALTSLTITFAGTATSQYHFDFISPATAVTLNLPSAVNMETSFHVEANTKYEIDIVNNEGVYAEWAVSSV